MRECKCRVADAPEGGPSTQPSSSEPSKSFLDLLAELLTTNKEILTALMAVVEQNQQFIDIAMHQSDDDDHPGYGLDGLPIHYR